MYTIAQLRDTFGLLVVFVLGACGGAMLMAWHVPRPNPLLAQVRVAHEQQCGALRELAFLLALTSKTGIPLADTLERLAMRGAIAGPADTERSVELAKEIYATPDVHPLTASRAVEARCLKERP